MTNIEQLKKETDEIKKWLDDLKNNVSLSEAEKKSKAEILKTQAEATKQKIQNEINSLESKTDDESKKEKEEAETLLNSFNETMNLYASILNSQESQETKKTEEKKEEKKTEDKGFFTKTKDWVWDQWSDVWDKEKRQKEWWKNLLRTAWFVATWVWAVALAYKWLKSLFWWWKDEEDEEDNEETGKKSKKKKKSFWKTGWGKFLKWTGIWAWSWLAVYWLWKRLGRWWKEWATWRDSDKEKYESYDEFIQKPENKEKFDNYEWLWDKVDNVYQEIFGRELKSWYEDELEMNKIAKEQSNWTKFYKWIVPYCLDNQFKSVEGILWQNSSFKTALNDWLDWMINFVKNAWWDFLKLFADSYLEFLPSWIPFKSMAWSLSDKIDQWKIKNENAEKEMQYFFRQSIRVQTYLFQKKDQLTKKIVKDAAQKYWKSENEIWNDQDLFDKYVVKDPQYQNFLNSPTHSAVTVLSQNNLFDNHIDEDLKKQVQEIDKDRNRILWCKEWEKDIIEQINEKKQNNETLDANDDKKLWEACDGILDSMDDIIEATEDSVWNIYEDLTRWGDANLREYLEKSWLDKMFESYKQILLAKKQELISGKLSNDDKIVLSETINAMLALKKEAELWQFTIEKDYDEYGNIIWRIPWFLYWSVKNLIKWVNKLIHREWLEWLAYIGSWFLWTWWTIMLVWWVRCFIDAKSWKKIATFGWKMVFSPVWAAYKWATRFKLVRDSLHGINPLKYKWENWAKILLQDLIDWRVSLDRAWKIIKRRCYTNIGAAETQRVWRKTFKTFGNTYDDVKWFDMRRLAFDRIVEEKRWELFLNQLKNESGLYDDLVKNWDASSDIRRAVVSSGGIEELKRLSKLSSVGDAVEIADSAARRAFNKSIDNVIAKLEWVANPDAVAHHIKELKKLQKDATLVDDEMECFVKFIDEWFDAKFIPEMKKLFNISDTFRGWGKIWDKLKELLTMWKYDEFKWLLKNPDLWKVFKWIQVDDMVKSFDKVLLKWGSAFWVETAKLLKSFMKILAKVL